MATEFPPLIELNGEVLFAPINQPQYDYLTATESNVFLYGDRGGGKSVVLRNGFHARALAYPGYRYAILRTSFPELIKNHLIYLKAEMKKFGGDYNASKFIAEYPNGSLGFYMQCETEEQARNALGVEMMGVGFDEAPTFLWDHMMMIASSVRVPPNCGLVPLKHFNGNPYGTSIDDLWRYFIDKDVDPEENPEYNPADWRAIRISHKDNTKLDIKSYRAQLASIGLSPALKKAWLDGERFDDKALFEVKPHIYVPRVDVETGETVQVKQPYHVIEELPKAMDANGNKVCVLELPWVRIQGSYDDGWIDPAVMLWYANVGEQVIVFNERQWTRTHSPEIAREILDRSVIFREDGTPYQLPLGTIYADPVIAKETTSVQSTMEVMANNWRCLVHGAVTKRCCDKARGLNFEPSTNSRELFSSAINRLLQAEVGHNTPKVQFLKVDERTDAGWALKQRGIIGCPYLLKYLPKMQFDEIDPRKMADHRHDHAPVAFAYKAMSHQIKANAPREDARRPAWWSDYFIGNSAIPRKQGQGRRKR